MSNPTRAEMAALVERLRPGNIWEDPDHRAVRQEAADAIEVLMQERAAFEVHVDHKTLASTSHEAMGAAPPAKPAGELPPLPEPVAHMWQHGETGNTGFVTNAPAEELAQWERINRPRKLVCPMFATDQMRAYAMRAIREME